MTDAKDMAMMCSPLYSELRQYIDANGVTALAMLAKGVNGATVADDAMPNVAQVVGSLLPSSEARVFPVLDVLTPEQMEERITAGEHSMMSAYLDIGLSADDCEMVIIDHTNPNVSLWICHTGTCSLLLLTTFAQLRELVELVVLADVQSAGIRAVH